MKNIKYFFYIIILLFLFLLSRFIFSINIFRNIIYNSLYPALYLQNKINLYLKNYFKYKKNIKELYDTIDYYKLENYNLKAKLIEYNSLKDYFYSFKELQSFAKRYKTQNAIFAQIILKNLENQNHFVYLDKGSNSGVKEDMVMVYKNFLLGKICQVYSYYSKAILITDSKINVAAYCTTNKTKCIYKGNGNMPPELDFIENNKDLLKGDLVISSGMGLIYPRGFGLGCIEKINNKDHNNSSAKLKSLINIENIDYCYLIEKGAELN